MCRPSLQYATVGNPSSIAPSHISKTFSVETEFYPEPLAVHKPWKYLTAEQVSLLENNMPGLATIKTANTNINININS